MSIAHWLGGKQISAVIVVTDVFEFRFNSSSPDLALFGRTSALNDTEFTIDIVDADNDGIAESATIDGVAAEIDGNTIKGADGTDYQGLELSYRRLIGTGLIVEIGVSQLERIDTFVGYYDYQGPDEASGRLFDSV